MLLVALSVGSCRSTQVGGTISHEENGQIRDGDVNADVQAINLYISKGYAKNLSISDVLSKIERSLEGIASDKRIVFKIYATGSQTAPQLIGVVPVQHSQSLDGRTPDASGLQWHPPTH